MWLFGAASGYRPKIGLRQSTASSEPQRPHNYWERGLSLATVDVALVLAVDSSGSISDEDLALQFHGYADAVTSEAFLNAVRSGPCGQIAITFVAWSSANRQEQVVPWTLLDGMSVARKFASALIHPPGLIPGYTSISGAIDFSVRLLAQCKFDPVRQVIDVSGDGTNNDGRTIIDARDAAIADGITINGLPIIGREPNIAGYYAENVVGGPAAFITVAKDIASFHSAVLQKLVAEIA